MSGYYDDSDDDYGQEQGPKALRDQLKKLEAKLAEATKALETERTEKAELSKQVKSTSLRNALSDAGIDPKYARFAERDEVEADVEAVKRWVEENKDVYAFLNAKPAPQEQVDSDDEGDESEDEVPEELLNQLLAGQSLEQAGRPSGSRTIADVLQAVDVSKFKSEQELDDFLFKQMGAPTVNG